MAMDSFLLLPPQWPGFDCDSQRAVHVSWHDMKQITAYAQQQLPQSQPVAATAMHTATATQPQPQPHNHSHNSNSAQGIRMRHGKGVVEARARRLELGGHPNTRCAQPPASVAQHACVWPVLVLVLNMYWIAMYMRTQRPCDQQPLFFCPAGASCCCPAMPTTKPCEMRVDLLQAACRRGGEREEGRKWGGGRL